MFTGEQLRAIRDDEHKRQTERNARPDCDGCMIVHAVAASWEVRLDGGISLELANILMYFSLEASEF